MVGVGGFTLSFPPPGLHRLRSLWYLNKFLSPIGPSPLLPCLCWGCVCVHCAPCVSPPVFIGCLLLSAPVFGYLGDRHSRKVTLSVGIILWSGAGLSSSFISPSVSTLTPAQAPRGPSLPPASCLIQPQQSPSCFCSLQGSRLAWGLPSEAERSPLDFLNRGLPLRPLHFRPTVLGLEWRVTSAGTGLVCKDDASSGQGVGGGLDTSRGRPCDMGNLDWEDSGA